MKQLSGTTPRAVLAYLAANLTPNVEREYTTAGSTTWTKPAGLHQAIVEVWGPGAGSGWAKGNNVDAGAGSGGAGGGYTKKLFDAAQLAAQETVTVGPGGIGGVVSPGHGTQGTPSSFTVQGVTTLIATGGKGGTGRTAAAEPPAAPPSEPGEGSGGDLNLKGSPGGPWTAGGTNGVSDLVSGQGGGAPYFGATAQGKTAAIGTAINGVSGFNPGAGASGGVVRGPGDGSAEGLGANGRQGRVKITEIFTIPQFG